MRKRGRPPADPEAIRTAASELFLQKGFGATTIHDIAVRAGVSTRTVYRYFESKADLAIAETAAQLALLEETVRSWPPQEPLGKAIENIAVAFATYLQNHPTYPICRPQYTDDPLFNRRRIEIVYAEAPFTVAKEFAARDGLRKPTSQHLLAARILLAILDQAVAEWVEAPTESLPDKVSALVANLAQILR